MTSLSAVFLDRDGTLNEDPGYLDDPKKLVLLPGVADSLAQLKAAGFLLVVVSNQSGVGRGLFLEAKLVEIHTRMNELLREAAPGKDPTIDQFLFCIHVPEANCDCRKPRTKLFVDSARALGISLRTSYMIGDKRSDLLAGKAAGCRGSLLVRTGSGSAAERELAPGEADFIAKGLTEAAAWILRQGIAAPESAAGRNPVSGK